MKTSVLFSGGWDSCAAYLKHRKAFPDSPIDLLFFDYGQNYLEKEGVSAQDFANFVAAPLVEHKIPNMVHDNERRNFLFLAEAKKLGYSRVILGVRNVLPIFDRYRDSNYVGIKLQAHLLNMVAELPICGWRKSRVVEYVQKSGYSNRPYNCYNDRLDFENCPCRNCEEMRNLA